MVAGNDRSKYFQDYLVLQNKAYFSIKKNNQVEAL